MARTHTKTGRSRGAAHGGFVRMMFNVMDTPAWLALSADAKALYPLIWRVAYAHGNEGNLSVRQAMKYLGVGKNRAPAVFHELQAKGFIVPVTIGCLGVAGQGKSTTWRVTELSHRGTPPTQDYNKWAPGFDRPVAKGAPPRKIQKPVPLRGTACPSQVDRVAL